MWLYLCLYERPVKYVILDRLDRSQMYLCLIIASSFLDLDLQGLGEMFLLGIS